MAPAPVALITSLVALGITLPPTLAVSGQTVTPDEPHHVASDFGVGRDHWGYDSFWWLSQAGIRVEVRRGPSEQAVTRYQFARLAAPLFPSLQEDLLRADERWVSDPALTWADVDPPHLQRREQTARWLMERMQDHSLLKRLSAGVRVPQRGWAATPATGYRDVPLTHPAYQAVNELRKQGVITGYPDGTFRGEQQLTTPELALAMVRIMTEINRHKSGRCYLQKKGTVQPAAEQGSVLQEVIPGATEH